MKPIDLSGFENKFADDADPWKTFGNRDEALKRDAILHGLDPQKAGRVLELGAGNGSNSQALVQRALRLDATEGTREGTRLVARAVADFSPRARAIRLAVPARPPRRRYDAVIIAELLYYLSARDMEGLALQTAALLRRGGTLLLAHHRKTFYDFAQRADGIHGRFLKATGRGWACRIVRQTQRWSVLACR